MTLSIFYIIYRHEPRWIQSRAWQGAAFDLAILGRQSVHSPMSACPLCPPVSPPIVGALDCGPRRLPPRIEGAEREGWNYCYLRYYVIDRGESERHSNQRRYCDWRRKLSGQTASDSSFGTATAPTRLVMQLQTDSEPNAKHLFVEKI